MNAPANIKPSVALRQLRAALEAESFIEFCDYAIINLEVAKMAAAAGDSHGRRAAAEKAAICLLAIIREEIGAAKGGHHERAD
jgi:hypothetical protein